MKLIIEQGSEKINSNGGLALVGAILATLNLEDRVNTIKIDGMRNPIISNADVLRSYIGLLTMGRTTYEEIELYRNDRYFRDVLGINQVPSSSILRQRLDCSKGKFDSVIKEINLQLLMTCPITPLQTELGVYVPLDMDVSPLDNSGTKKEKVSRTYKGHDGFAPNFAYLGAEGNIINSELRPGKQHCQSGTPEFLTETLDFVDFLTLGKEILLRLDSGNDSQENIRRVHRRCKYIIKRNLRRENPDDWLEIAKIYGRKTEPRDGKTIYIGECYRFMETRNGITEPLRIVFEVTIRTIKANGETLLLPEIAIDTYWTNLMEWAETVIELYHDHGTSEQYHSELKSDMGVERLPSGKFVTNATILQTAMIAFNVLRKIGQDLLSFAGDLPIKLTMKRRRLRKVIQDIIYMACKYVQTGNRFKLRLGAYCPWYNPFKRLYLSYLS